MSDSGEDPIFELARHYRFQWEPAQSAFVLVYPEGMVKLGGSAGEILKRVDGNSPVSAIISDLERAFPGVDLRRDVTAFLVHARENGCLRPRSAGPGPAALAARGAALPLPPPLRLLLEPGRLHPVQGRAHDRRVAPRTARGARARRPAPRGLGRRG